MTKPDLPKARSALQGLFIGDALAMPAHWFYRIFDIEQTFNGGITQFEAAPTHHPSSIMSLHSTAAGGRKTAQKQPQTTIVGDVILKGKAAYWDVPYQHYHQGMQAGENTLNAHCARLLMRCLAQHQGQYHPQAFLADYIAFMTADPPQHPDTYAESYHRAFFANYIQGVPAEQCGAITHDTASIGGLVTLAPLVIAAYLQSTDPNTIQQQVKQHLYFTHPDAALAKVADDYTTLILALWHSSNPEDARNLLEQTAKNSGFNLAKLIAKKPDDRQVIGQLFSPACYISDSWPAVLYLAHKYAEDPIAGLLANANLGGDNAHRGSVLGVLLGLINPNKFDAWFEQLVEKQAIADEINALTSSGHQG
jgi:ADP-ribosylglycohydrolase